jgi:hypothetical protein
MPSYPKTTHELLRRRLQEIEEELERQAPALTKERHAILRALDSLVTDANLRYNTVTSPWEAISRVLDDKGDWKISKKDIIGEIMAGGYQASAPKKARGLLNDSLNHHIKKGFLSLRGELVGRPKGTSVKRS